MTLSTALFIFAAQLLAYLVKGLIGFGNPLISAPILSMGLDNVVITPGTLLLDCPVNAWITWKNRHSFQWRKILPLLAANFCGVIPGTLLLRFSMPWVIKTVLGVVVVLLGAGDGHPLPAAGEAGPEGPALAAAGGVRVLRRVRGPLRHQHVHRGLPPANSQRLQRVQGEHVLSLLWGECGAGSDLSSHRPVHRPGAAVRPGVCSRGGAGHGAWRRGWGPGWKRKSSKRAPSSSSSWAASASS